MKNITTLEKNLTFGRFNSPYREGSCVYGVYQCSRANGFGPEGLYCKQHAEALTAGVSIKKGKIKRCEKHIKDLQAKLTKVDEPEVA